MASEPDDNPFARNSVWPKMPQAPFRVGPLPRSDSGPPLNLPPEAEPSPEPAPTTVTPVFVRPAVGVPMGLGGGGATPQGQPRPVPAPPAFDPRPAAPLPAEGAAIVREPEAAPAVSPPPVAAPPATPAQPTFVEVAPVIVQPVGSVRSKARKRSWTPVWTAAAVGAVGLAGLVFLFSRGQQAAPTAAPPVVTAIAPATPALETPPTVTAAAPQPVTASATAPTRVAASAPRLPARSPPPHIVLPEASAAAEEVNNAPVIALPPPAPAPRPEPLPAYTPTPAPDPNAPITTRRPY